MCYFCILKTACFYDLDSLLCAMFEKTFFYFRYRVPCIVNPLFYVSDTALFVQFKNCTLFIIIVFVLASAFHTYMGWTISFELLAISVISRSLLTGHF